MREGNYEGEGGRKGWDKFCKDHCMIGKDTPHPTTILEDLDKHLEKQGKEVVTVDVGTPDTFFRIEDREG